MDLQAQGYKLAGLKRINVLLGKNGAGKSTILKACEAGVDPSQVATKRYVTPERGGALVYEGNVEQTMMQNPTWMADTRRVNQFERFRQQSIAQFRRLELLVLRQSELAREVADFNGFITRLNSLLDNIELRRDEATFTIHSQTSGERIDPASISSGEAELISLGIEVLMFGQDAVPGQANVLFLDEPDVHLHPDLQDRLVAFLVRSVEERDFIVVLATHSTAILGGLADYADATVAFMKAGETDLAFSSISETHRRVLPVFGAHPLSNVFNAAPVLIVEGEDDERIWQQVVRTSAGRLKVYPVACDGVADMHAYELEVARIVDAVYDSGRAFSLRDGDGIDTRLDPEGPVIRMRLACRAAENLLLSDDVLAGTGTSWDEVRERIERWLELGSDHPRYTAMAAFAHDGFDRRQHDLKELRMLLAGSILSTTKPWEVLVGQAIGALVGANAGASAPDSLESYLGAEVMTHILTSA
jgi:energy-coupling factor transporter ATP-binding protein EcfA2